MSKQYNDAELLAIYKKSPNEFFRVIKPFVIWCVKKFKMSSQCGVDFSDLCQIGHLACLEVLPTFDAEKGSLLSWLRLRINARVIDQLRKSGVVRDGEADSRREIREAEKYLREKRRIRWPSNEQIAELLGRDVEHIKKHRQSTGLTFCSLDDAGHVECDGATPADLLLSKERAKAVRDCLDEMGSRESRVLCLLYGIDCKALTVDQICDRYGLKERTVFRLKAQAIEALRSCLSDN